MLLSMTGYGRANGTYEYKNITIEIRSLNSKMTDLRIKAPQNLKEKEIDMRRMVLGFAERGKLELSIDIRSTNGEGESGLNVPLIRRYHRELTELSGELGIDQGDILQAIVRLPNVVTLVNDEMPDAEWKALRTILREALENFNEFRLAEGKAMEDDLRDRITAIQQLLEEVAPYEAERRELSRERLYRNLEDGMAKDKIDANRFEQELIFYLERMDINEEKTRLAQHCIFFLEELDSADTVKGRKLAFISQEIGREINTLGAKAYSSDIQRLVVSMKDELEKIKEQIANIV